MNKARKNTLLLLAGLLLVLGIGYVVQRQLTADDDTASELYAEIEVNGEPYASLPLSEDQEMMINDAAGNFNLVKVEDGAVFVEDANCGDLTCVHMGKMQYEGNIIACLPHGMIIYIRAES